MRYYLHSSFGTKIYIIENKRKIISFFCLYFSVPPSSPILPSLSDDSKVTRIPVKEESKFTFI